MMPEGIKFSVFALLCCVVFSVSMINSGQAYEPESILGVWLFDEEKGNEVLDSSEKGHNGTITNIDVERVDGQFGEALSFVGGGKVTVPHAEDLVTPVFTLMTWIKVDDFTDAYQLIVGKDGWPNRNYGMFVQKDTGKLHFAFCSPVQQDAGNMNSNMVVTDGEWHHIAATYDMAMEKIYIDGILDSTKQSAMEPSESTVDIEIGRSFVGIIDEVLIANEAFELDDIAKAMELGLAEFIGGGAIVSASGKLTSTWGAIRSAAAN